MPRIQAAWKRSPPQPHPSVSSPLSPPRTRPLRRPLGRELLHAAELLALALLSFLLLGYHPFAEDGGIYAAAAEARRDPLLFPHDRVWVTAHTRFALFTPLVAEVSRLMHLQVPAILLGLQFAGLVALLAAAHHMARTTLPWLARPWLAVACVAVGAGLPVAGTALYAVDPYCTARTLTTPLLLFSWSLALRRRWLFSALCWLAAATMHPLMAIWGSLPLLVTVALATRSPRRWTAALAGCIAAAALLLCHLSRPETAATRLVAHTRAYWFPAAWRWFEWIGAAAPCLILVLAATHRSAATSARKAALSLQDPIPSNLRRFTLAALASTALSVATALCFAREAAPSLAVARLQPFRGLHLVFVAFLAVGGAILQRVTAARGRRIAALACLGLAAAALFGMQRSLYPNTPHLEWAGSRNNPWQTAFLWCRRNTPPDALFALDSRYIDLSGEDTVGFRAVALRSALPDAIKDAGIAAVLPELTGAWQAGVAATQDLDRIPDTERRSRLLPLGVTWIVLPASAKTGLPCPFRNSGAQVCRLQ